MKRSVLTLSSCVLLSCLSALAQGNPNLENGLKPYGSYEGGNIDSINMAIAMPPWKP